MIFASEAQAVSGTSNAVVMSPLRVSQAIAAKGGSGGGSVGPQGPKGDKGDTGPQGPKGDSGSGGSGSGNAAQVTYYPTPQIAVPVAQRLGMEVVLTDGYTEGSNLSDFSDLIEANLARAAALRRPFVIPSGKFAATRKFSASGVPISLFGFGPTMSVVEWEAGSASSGFDFSFDDDGDFAFFEDFGLYTKLFNQGTALRASFAGKIIANNGNPVIVSRFQPCGRARGLVVRGTDGTLTNGFNRGIEIDAPLGFNVQDCHLWGASNGADPNYASDTAIYLGKAQGVGHPVECSIKDCRTFRWNYGIVAEGMEGVLAHFNQLVGVGVGIYFKDELSRPHFDFSHNHVNAAKVCVQVDSASQMFIQDNELFQVINANETGYGVSISGPSQHAHICNNSFESAIQSNARFEAITVFKCDHGVIDGNTFRPTVQQPGYTVDMRGITLSADARFFKVGHTNVFQNPDSGSVYGPIAGLVTKLVDYGVQNVIPGMGLDKRKRSGSQYTGPGDYTIVTFDSSEGVSGNAFAPNNPAEAIVVPVDGLWQFEATVHWEANGPAGQRNVWITVDGAGLDNAIVFDTNLSNASNLVVQTLSVTVPLARGQVVRVMVQASNATNVMGGRWTRLAARRLA